MNNIPGGKGDSLTLCVAIIFIGGGTGILLYFFFGKLYSVFMEGGGLLLEFYDLFFVGVDEDSMVFFCGKLMILCGEKISIILFMGKPMILFGENCVILSRGIS